MTPAAVCTERRAKPLKTLLLDHVPDPHLLFAPDAFQIVRPRPWYTFDVDESMQVRTFSGVPQDYSELPPVYVVGEVFRRCIRARIWVLRCASLPTRGR